ncbi:hypothetical protein Tco_0608447 [Tanacetum coccineum]
MKKPARWAKVEKEMRSVQDEAGGKVGTTGLSLEANEVGKDVDGVLTCGPNIYPGAEPRPLIMAFSNPISQAYLVHGISVDTLLEVNPQNHQLHFRRSGMALHMLASICGKKDGRRMLVIEGNWVGTDVVTLEMEPLLLAAVELFFYRKSLFSYGFVETRKSALISGCY